MAKFEDLTGQKFGRWTVIKQAERNERRHIYWLCKCECGNEARVTTGSLKSGNSKSCGCLRTEKTIKRSTIHGLRNTRLNYIWRGMKNRCYNPNSKKYPIYGGRGIIVCDEWKNNFKSFYNWAKNNGYKENLTIDRINVNGNYEPSNCRWATAKEQANNRTNSHVLTFNNETHTLSEWSRITGICRLTLFTRLKRGWSIKRALTIPVNK